MIERPSTLPEWAVQDIVDPISKNNNVVEPSSVKKLYGWAYKEKPNRQWFNSLFRSYWKWLSYLDSHRLVSYTVATLPSASTRGAGTQIYVSDESGGAVIAFSDGTNWRRTTDRAIVS